MSTAKVVATTVAKSPEENNETEFKTRVEDAGAVGHIFAHLTKKHGLQKFAATLGDEGLAGHQRDEGGHERKAAAAVVVGVARLGRWTTTHLDRQRRRRNGWRPNRRAGLCCVKSVQISWCVTRISCAESRSQLGF